MALDASIYSQQRQVQAPDVMGSMAKAQNLRGMAQEQDQRQQQMDQTQHLQKASQFGTALEGLAALPADQRVAAYPKLHAEMVQSGVIKPGDAPPEYDEGFFRQSLTRFQQTKEGIDRALEKAKTQNLMAETMKHKAEASMIGGKESGKPLAAEQTDKIAGHDSSLHMIQDLRATIMSNKENFGPVAGRLSALNPYDQRGQSVSALFKKGAQTIGKSLEGGKLTDSDYAKYQAMLPKQSDTPEVANAKLDQLERMVASQRNADLGAYEQAGSNVGRFSKSAVPDIAIARAKGGQGGGMISDAVAGGMPKAPKGQILMQAPDGSLRFVPLSQKGEAIAAGGKVAK